MNIADDPVAVAKVLQHHLSTSTVVSQGGGGEPGLWFETGRRPALRVECGSVADIRIVTRVAADHGLPITVWGGRRDVAGRNAGDGELVVDLRRHRFVRPHPSRETITVGGGATARDVLATLPTDEVTVTTSNLDVGMVGAGTGGGYGPLTCRYGLICDQLVGAHLVLADGSEIDAGPAGDEELLWGLRGGGPGFGIVTEATFSTHRLESIRHAAFVVPLTAAMNALLTMQELLDTEPDHLSVLPLFAVGPDGHPALTLMTHWNGPERLGERIIGALAAIPSAESVIDQRVAYATSFNYAEDGLWPTGQRWATRSGTIARIDHNTAGHLVNGAEAMPSSRSVLFLHDFHGAPTSVAPSATAFPLRGRHYVAMAAGSAEVDDEAAWLREQTWADQVIGTLKDQALPGGYVNFLAPSETDRVTSFYGSSMSRLTELKNRLDPQRAFGSVAGIGAVLGR